MPSFLNLVAEDLVNQELNLFDLLLDNEELIFQIAGKMDFLDQIALRKHIFAVKLRRKPSQLTRKLIHDIHETKGNLRIKQLEEFTG